MSEELTPKEQAMVTQLEATKITLGPEDVLFVTIKSDDIDEFSLNALKKNLGRMFPNNKVAVLGMGTRDGVEFTIATKPELSYSEQEQEKEPK